MHILITYDVCTQTPQGKKRLRKVAKTCVNYGVRVQNSVFECVVDPSQNRILKQKLLDIIDEKEDSLRIYTLGKKEKIRVECFGCKIPLNLEEPIIF